MVASETPPRSSAPALVAVIHGDDVALGKIFGAVFERRLGVINKGFKAVQIAGVSELAEAAFAGDVVDIQVGWAAQAVNRLLEQLLGFGGALRGQHDFILRERGRRRGEPGAREQQ